MTASNTAEESASDGFLGRDGIRVDAGAPGWAHANGREPRRTPHFTHAIEQARAAAATLVLGEAAGPCRSTPYFWTEPFGMTVKICGQLPLTGVPRLLEGSLSERSAVLRWEEGALPTAAVTISHRMPLKKLRALAGA